ncbi:hypothetical protein ACLOJK_001803 [Asimina triloba]
MATQRISNTAYPSLLIQTSIFVKEEDIGTYTFKAVDDPRTLNKSLYLRPPANMYSMNDLVSLWEKKIGKTLEKVYIPEEQLLKDIQAQDSAEPEKITLSIGHCLCEGRP